MLGALGASRGIRGACGLVQVDYREQRAVLKVGADSAETGLVAGAVEHHLVPVPDRVAEVAQRIAERAVEGHGDVDAPIGAHERDLA